MIQENREKVSWGIITQNLYKDDNYRRMLEIHNFVYSFINEDMGGRKLKILDIGCGDGSLLGDFTSQHGIYGVDITAE